MNAIKVFVSLISNVIAAATFVGLEIWRPTGALVWRAALLLSLGALAGGFMGVRIARRLPPARLRAVSALIGLVIAAQLLLRRPARALTIRLTSN